MPRITTESQPSYAPNKIFVEWLNSGLGRAAALSRADKELQPAIISKLKHGVNPITISYAIRIERAQQQIPSKKQLRAEKIVTRKADAELIRFLRGSAQAE